MRALRIFFFFAWTLVLLLFSLQTVLFSEPYYEKTLEQSGVFTVLQREEALEQVHALVLFLRGNTEFGSSFNEKEQLHMEDVRGLVRLSERLLAFLFVVCVAWLLCSSRKLELLRRASLFTLVVVGVGGLIVLLSFSSSFLIFHQLSFTNDLWMLDPATDRLIVLFPETFFSTALTDIVLRTLGMAAAVFLACSLRLRTRVCVSRRSSHGSHRRAGF